MKNRIILFFICFVYLLSFFRFDVYAVNDTLSLDPKYGVSRYSGSQFALFGPSNPSYSTNCLFSYVKGADLKQYDSLTVHTASPSKKINLFFMSSDSIPSFVNPTGDGRTYVNFAHRLEFTSGYVTSDSSGYINIDFPELMTQPIENDKYYFVTTTTYKCDSVVFSRSAPASTPTPAPSSSPAPSGDGSRAILGQYFVDSGQTADINKSFKVFPYHVEVNDSVDGKNYILHYRMSLPARFYYYGHSGTGYSFPVLDENVTISPYFTNIPYDFSVSRAYIDSQVSYDSYDNLKSVTSPSGNGFVLSGNFGYSLYNVPVIDEMSEFSYDLCLEWSIVVNKFSTDTVFVTPSEYECTVTVNSLRYKDDLQHVADQLDSDALNQIKDNTASIRDEQKKQDDLENERYEDEQEKISEAESSITDGVGKVTETLSSWEIFTMPFQLINDLLKALTSEGSTGLTFPAFELMGHQLWPSYTFDLQVIAEKFPVLYNGLHLITGIMVVSWFIHYCWRKWHILFDDDMPEI